MLFNEWIPSPTREPDINFPPSSVFDQIPFFHFLVCRLFAPPLFRWSPKSEFITSSEWPSDTFPVSLTLACFHWFTATWCVFWQCLSVLVVGCWVNHSLLLSIFRMIQQIPSRRKPSTSCCCFLCMSKVFKLFLKPSWWPAEQHQNCRQQCCAPHEPKGNHVSPSLLCADCTKPSVFPTCDSHLPVISSMRNSQKCKPLVSFIIHMHQEF